eukprot:800588-Pelagomonas_calceolata.AAC.1
MAARAPFSHHPLECTHHYHTSVPGNLLARLHTYGFQQRICSADPLDLSQLVVDLRTLIKLTGDDAPFIIHKVSTAKKITYHLWCSLPTKNVHITNPPHILPKPIPGLT